MWTLMFMGMFFFLRTEKPQCLRFLHWTTSHSELLQTPSGDFAAPLRVLYPCLLALEVRCRRQPAKTSPIMGSATSNCPHGLNGFNPSTIEQTLRSSSGFELIKRMASCGSPAGLAEATIYVDVCQQIQHFLQVQSPLLVVKLCSSHAIEVDQDSWSQNVLAPNPTFAHTRRTHPNNIVYLSSEQIWKHWLYAGILTVVFLVFRVFIWVFGFYVFKVLGLSVFWVLGALGFGQ